MSALGGSRKPKKHSRMCSLDRWGRRPGWPGWPALRRPAAWRRPPQRPSLPALDASGCSRLTQHIPPGRDACGEDTARHCTPTCTVKVHSYIMAARGGVIRKQAYRWDDQRNAGLVPTRVDSATGSAGWPFWVVRACVCRSNPKPKPQGRTGCRDGRRRPWATLRPCEPCSVW